MGRWCGAAIGCWFLASAALATPEDDFGRGRQAYARGDVVAAMVALRAGATGGHAPSMSLLAFILDRSDAGTEALALYRQAAAKGDAEGCAGLANFYLAGRGVAKDENEAFRQFSKAADAGHAASIELIANAYLGGQMSSVVPGDTALAEAAVRRAAGLDHLPSVDALASAYATGRFGLVADAEQAATWRNRGAELRKRRPLPPRKAAS